jgi:hypothetical protein
LPAASSDLTLGEEMNALTRFVIVLVLILGAGTLLAQSLGDVARETRNAPRPRAKKVVTNDEIPPVDTMSTASAAKDSAEGNDSKTNPKGENRADGEKDAKGAGSGSAARAPAKNAEEQRKLEAEWNAKFSQEQEKISLLDREFKVSEQEYKQKQITHMADVNGRVNNQEQYAQAEKLDQEDLAQKREKLNAERQKLESMQEDARHAGVKLPD